MRRLIFAFIMLCGVGAFVLSCSDHADRPMTGVKLYFADSELSRLLPYDDEIPAGDTESMVQSAMDKLTEGRDDNSKIRRLLPSKRINTYIRTNTAYVDLAPQITEQLPKSRDIERLVIYQIVDTLTGIKGISYVKFTVGGVVRKDFMGYFDMRETYKYKYPE